LDHRKWCHKFGYIIDGWFTSTVKNVPDSKFQFPTRIGISPT
jgi:hypothetical protein